MSAPQDDPETRAAAPAPPPDEAPARDPRPVEEGGDAYHTRILIRPGGEVVIENLSMDLLELAELLDPDAKIVCEPEI